MSAARAVAASAAPPPADGLRSGARYWLSSVRVMLRFDLGRARAWAPIMVVVQALMGAGMALIYGFFYPHPVGPVALYITTGTPTLALVPLGFVMVPQAISQQRMEGTFEYIWSLPTPRSAQAASSFLLYTLLALPGSALALLVAAWRYGVTLHPSPALAAAVAVSALMSVTVGFGMALAVPNPLLVGLITNALVFVVLLFSPVVYPVSQLPGWLHALHLALPFYNMAVVIRAGLTTGVVARVGTSYLVLGAWTVAGCLVTAWVVGRRR